MSVILTIGHSNHALPQFLSLLAGVEMVVDLRSTPASRRVPHYNKATLATALNAAGVSYLWMGRELGGRPDDRALYSDGIADYERMAGRPSFAAAIARLSAEAEWLRLALMCAEKDPLDCHRCLLVGRALAATGVEVQHILADGSTITQAAIEEDMLSSRESDLFQPASREALLAAAYRLRARRNAQRLRQSGP